MINNLTSEKYAAAVADMVMANMGGHRINDARLTPFPLTQCVDVVMDGDSNDLIFTTMLDDEENCTKVCFNVHLGNSDDTQHGNRNMAFITMEEFWELTRNAIRDNIYNAVLDATEECWGEIKDITTITPDLIKAHPVLMFIIQVAPYPLKSGKLIRNMYVEYSEKHLKRVIPIELVCADCVKACSDLSITIKFNKKTGHRRCSGKALMKSP